jgi:hypothetical protein
MAPYSLDAIEGEITPFPLKRANKMILLAALRHLGTGRSNDRNQGRWVLWPFLLLRGFLRSEMQDESLKHIARDCQVWCRERLISMQSRSRMCH